MLFKRLFLNITSTPNGVFDNYVGFQYQRLSFDNTAGVFAGGELSLFAEDHPSEPPPLPVDACQPLKIELADLQSDLGQSQLDFQSATGSEKASIKAEIDDLKAKIKNKEKEIAQCEAGPGPGPGPGPRAPSPRVIGSG